jgi:hypothetical protein
MVTLVDTSEVDDTLGRLVISLDCATDGVGPGAGVSDGGGGAGVCGAGGFTCSGTVGGGLFGASLVDGPSITDFLDTSPTACSDLASPDSSSGPSDSTFGMDP